MRRFVRVSRLVLARSCHTARTTNTTRDGGAELEGVSPFLADLLDPPVTVELQDATRTYRTMDVVPRCDVYDPAEPNATGAGEGEGDGAQIPPWLSAAAGTGEQQPQQQRQKQPALGDTEQHQRESQGSSGGGGGEFSSVADEGPVARAHREGRLWSVFAGNEGKATPPAWFEELCRDLFFRRGGGDDGFDTAAAQSDPAADAAAEHAARTGGWRELPEHDSAAAQGAATAAVDPYLWLPFDLLDEADYHVGPYRFPPTATYSLEQRLRLCLGDPAREYVHFCNTYAFPDRAQLPTSVGTVPSRLLVDPRSPTPLVYVQLSPDVPPCMWLPVRPTAGALRRVLGEYARQAVLHRDAHHATFERRLEDVRKVMALQRLPHTSDGDVLRFMGYEARNTPYAEAPIREFRNEQEFFLGEYDEPERLLEHLELCPMLFAIPHLRTVADPHAEHLTPTVDGPGVAPSLFRCVYSKALLFVTVQLSAEVKLPPQDPEAFEFMWKDSQVVPKMKIPVFARVVWPDSEGGRLGGGGALLRRFNALFNTEFAPDMPPDAALALFYVATWARAVPDLLGVRGMRQRVAELEAAARSPAGAEREQLYPSTREIPNPEYTLAERLGMHVQYLAMLGDPDISQTLRNLLPTAPAAVRMGCAKAALIAGDRALFRQIVSSEPPGRMQLYMTKIVRKRKTRDLTDPEPRLLEEQYEFAAPLWTRRGRIDANTLEGSLARQAIR